MINLVVCGAAGRMGQAVVEALRESTEFKLTGAIERPDHPLMGKPLYEGGPTVVNDLLLTMNAGDVIVEFCTAKGAMANATKAAIIKKPMVMGSTGLSDSQREIIEGLAKEIPVVASSNMSIGVNLLYKLVYAAAKRLPQGYDVEILESHHRMKKDAPSGTAKRLLDEVLKARGGTPVYERQSRTAARDPSEVGIYSLRAGDIVGEHTVYFVGQGERIELTHRVHNRRVFAEGALLAAKFVATSKPGLYDMQDVLGLK